MFDPNTVLSTTDLPNSYFREIGRIIVNYAHLEKVFHNILFGLMETPRDIGETCVRQPRLQDVIQMIEDVCEIKNIPHDKDQLKEIKKKIERVKILRDLVAHGVWVMHPNHQNPMLVKTRGKWNPKEVSDYNVPTRHKSSIPEALNFSSSVLRSYTKGIKDIRDEATKLITAFGL